MSFVNIILVGSFLGFMISLAIGLWPNNGARYGSPFGTDFQSNKRKLVGYSHDIYATIAPVSMSC